MASYDVIARFYDSVVGDRCGLAHDVRRLVETHRPQARTLLDLACGTGSLLPHLSPHYEVAGLDLSTAMLARARDRLPETALYHGDMTTFELDGSFDAVICMFDSINHLLRFSDWQQVFARVHAHLNPSGIFLFDVNTVHRLKTMASSPPWVHEFDVNLLVMDLSLGPQGVCAWNIRIFEALTQGLYRLHEETIHEKSFPVHRIRKALSKFFVGIRIVDPTRKRVSPKSERLYFVGLKR